MKKLISNMRLIILIAAAALYLSGCDCSLNPFSACPPEYDANFTANATGASPGASLQKNRLSGTTVWIDVELAGVNALYGAEIKISYDANKVNWGGTYSAGSLLETSGTPVYQVGLDSGMEGTLVIGATLQGGASTVSSDGILISIPFNAISEGNSNISFLTANLYDNTTPTPALLTLNSTTGGILSGSNSSY